ncbi:hypothetical protein [Alistipes sp.]|uniref:hypothetical protein n=1 Tax=Alistipes sp. TaxID=1872444 RepID=UPI003AB25508
MPCKMRIAGNALDGIRKDTSLRGTTLVETLVMMLVAGIVFLAVMDGLTLFTRLQTPRAEALLTGGRQRYGYFRLEALVSGADSILTGRDRLEVYCGGRLSELSVRDSALVYRVVEFRDTLLTGVAGMGLSRAKPDTLEVALAAGFTVRFPVKSPSAERYRESLDELEKGYGYEE